MPGFGIENEYELAVRRLPFCPNQGTSRSCSSCVASSRKLYRTTVRMEETASISLAALSETLDG